MVLTELPLESEASEIAPRRRLEGVPGLARWRRCLTPRGRFLRRRLPGCARSRSRPRGRGAGAGRGGVPSAAAGAERRSARGGSRIEGLLETRGELAPWGGRRERAHARDPPGSAGAGLPKPRAEDPALATRIRSTDIASSSCCTVSSAPHGSTRTRTTRSVHPRPSWRKCSRASSNAWVSCTSCWRRGWPTSTTCACARPREHAVIDHLAADLDRHQLGGVSFHGELDATPSSGSRAGWRARPRSAARGRVAGTAGRARRVEISGRWRFGASAEPAPPVPNDGLDPRHAARDVRDTLRRVDAGWMPNLVRLRRVVIDIVESLPPTRARRARPLRRLTAASGTSSRSASCRCCSARRSVCARRASPTSEWRPSSTMSAPSRGGIRSVTPGRESAGCCVSAVRAAPGPAVCWPCSSTRNRPPARGRGWRPSLFARILHVTEHYDLMVAARPWRRGSRPRTALERMWADPGRRYDPVLLALFVRELGRRHPARCSSFPTGAGRSSCGRVAAANAGRSPWCGWCARRPKASPSDEPSSTSAPAGVARAVVVIEPAQLESPDLRRRVPRRLDAASRGRRRAAPGDGTPATTRDLQARTLPQELEAAGRSISWAVRVTLAHLRK